MLDKILARNKLSHETGLFAKTRHIITVSRRTKIIAIILFVAVVAYEIAFRICTAECGEVDIHVQPPRVYYSKDLDLPFPLLHYCFGFRAELPFGKVRPSKGSGAYVDGSRFYRRLSDGSWQDFTDQLIEYQKAGFHKPVNQ